MRACAFFLNFVFPFTVTVLYSGHYVLVYFMCSDLQERLSSETEKFTKLNSSTSQLKQKTEELLVTVQTEQERCRVLSDEKLKLVGCVVGDIAVGTVLECLCLKEEQITLLRSETGDSSQQLSFLDLQLKEKER